MRRAAHTVQLHDQQRANAVGEADANAAELARTVRGALSTACVMPDWRHHSRFAGWCRLRVAVPSPGVRSLATVSLTPTGTVPTTGKLEIVMPDLGGDVQAQWQFDAKPSVVFTTPSVDAPQHCAPTNAGCALEITILVHLLRQGVRTHSQSVARTIIGATQLARHDRHNDPPWQTH